VGRSYHVCDLYGFSWFWIVVLQEQLVTRTRTWCINVLLDWLTKRSIKQLKILMFASSCACHSLCCKVMSLLHFSVSTVSCTTSLRSCTDRVLQQTRRLENRRGRSQFWQATCSAGVLEAFCVASVVPFTGRITPSRISESPIYVVLCWCLLYGSVLFFNFTTRDNTLFLGQSHVKPKFHLARHVTSWHDSTRSTCRASWDEHVERVEPCCSNMADSEQAIVLACTSLVVFMLFYTQILFVPSN